MKIPRLKFVRNFSIVGLTILALTSSVCAINKCCPKNQAFNLSYICVDVHSVGNVSTLDEEWRNWTTEQSFQVTSTSLPCSLTLSKTIRYNKIKLFKNGKIFLTNETVLPEADYCFEFYPDKESNYSTFIKYVYFCPCVNLLCIWKCCLNGTVLRSDTSNPPELDCFLDSHNPDWNIRKMNISKVPEDVTTKFDLKRCDNLTSYGFKLTGKNKYSLQKNGSIIIYDYAVEIGKFDYCGDMELTPGGTYEPVVIACMPKPPIKKKVLIEGILNSIGSFFLFLTIALHIWLPELHSLPGKCLTCHASCLLVALICVSINQLLITSPSPTDIGCCILGKLVKKLLEKVFLYNVL